MENQLASGHLKPVLEELKELMDASVEFENACGYMPIGDICNRIFPIPPEPGTDRSHRYFADFDQFLKKVKAVNSHLATIKKRHLKNTKHKNNIVVAGGSQKARAIYALLLEQFPSEQGPFSVPVSLLVTDDKTLKRLIEFGEREQV